MTTPTTPHDSATAPRPPERVQWRRAGRALRRLVADSSRTEEVFDLIEALSGPGRDRALQRFAADPHGRRLLEERPSLLEALQDRERLAALPEESLGRAYLGFMDEAGLDAGGLVEASRRPGDRPTAPRTGDAGAESGDPGVSGLDAWLGDRLRDMHDLWHVVTGYGRDEAGEVALLAFTYARLRNRAIGAIAGVGAVIGAVQGGGLAWPRYLWRAYRRGCTAEGLEVAPWEAWLGRPLADVRRDLAIEPPERAHPEGIVVASRVGEGQLVAGPGA